MIKRYYTNYEDMNEADDGELCYWKDHEADLKSKLDELAIRIQTGYTEAAEIPTIANWTHQNLVKDIMNEWKD